MKHYFKIVIKIGIVYVICLCIPLILARNTSPGRADSADYLVMLNEISKTAELHWDNIEGNIHSDYDAEFVILDSNSNIVFTNSVDDRIPDRISIETAIRNRFPYVYIFKDEKCVGSVILLDDGTKHLNNIRMRTVLWLFGAGLVIILGAIYYGTYVNNNIYKPFKQMEEFAGKVAEGNLDMPLIMDRQNIFGSFTESFDIMREELIKSREREIALQKKEREIVASLSHDIKTPITGIKVTTELLEAKLVGSDEPIAHDFTGGLRNIMKKADQIDSLVSDLFSSTLDDLGEIKVNLCDEEASVLNDIVARYDDRRLVRSSLIPPALVNIDFRRMGQVIGNIISNSYKYANTIIDVDYKIVDDFLSMRIKDYGPGVAFEELGLITNKFYRGKITREGKQDGSGLGLYISKMLMTKMNGELIPENDGNGLAITLLIPLS